MILNPAVISLVSGSLLVTFFAVYASHIGLQIIGSWDMESGSEWQLTLERKTYLVSTIFSYLACFELFSLFLFVYTSDHIHTMFVGAMCAAGSLNVNGFGYPTLILKVAAFFLCGIWIILNHTDNRGYDYPLIRTKYRFLMWITVILVFETLFLMRYFMDMRADVITSCCGSLFSESDRSLAGDLAGLPSHATKILFYLTMALTVRTGIHFLATGRGPRVFSGFAAWATVFSLASIISFISLYFYELPTHHCPFCLLQKEYGYIGYPLYLFLLMAGITGTAVGVIETARRRPSLRETVPAIQRKLCLISMVCFLLFTGIASYPILFSDFILEGY